MVGEKKVGLRELLSVLSEETLIAKTHLIQEVSEYTSTPHLGPSSDIYLHKRNGRKRQKQKGLAAQRRGLGFGERLRDL